jgi:iron(II)-dependent oxidoreductase
MAVAISSTTRERVTHSSVLADLAAARRRTLELLRPLTDDELVEQVSPLQSPLVWDFAHIAYFEELWLLRRVGGDTATDGRFDDLYDAFRHERKERGGLPILRPNRAREYAAEVRGRVVELIRNVELDEADPLLADGFVFGMVVQHELQHCETMLQTLALRDRPYAAAPRETPLPEAARPAVALPAGRFRMGTDEAPWAYDNERPAHEVELPAFAIDALPVSNAQFLAFVEAGGYGDVACWSEGGRAWLQAEAPRAPLGWERTTRGWRRRRFGRVAPLVAEAPVQHVSFWEAEAYARWAGGRLPSEAEWERAAPRLLGRGRVWEWTSSPFAGYPGFEAFPYAEYSQVFFGDEHRVLRGGSWATHPTVARLTFRNWDYPGRRQILSGVRVARDAG